MTRSKVEGSLVARIGALATQIRAECRQHTLSLADVDPRRRRRSAKILDGDLKVGDIAMLNLSKECA